MEKRKTRNHHYISQVEQRLNAIDPHVKPDNQRIFQFRVVRPEPPLIELVDETGRRIEKNLTRRDLYTLKKLPGGGQHNLESAFQVYEDDVGLLTKSLLEKIKDPRRVDIKVEIVRMYLLKMMNAFRNPHSIIRTLETLSLLEGVVPGDSILRDHFASLNNVTMAQASKLAAEFNVTEQQYITWLKTLYLLILQPLDGGMNLLEHLVKGLMESPRFIKTITVLQYEGQHEDSGILIGDRGWVDISHEEGMTN